MVDKLQLNSEQKEAIKHREGTLLIIAGAGTGKTTVVTERIKHLILKGIIEPQEVLALTFTEKAAKEMQDRVDVAMPYGYTQMWISTFHSFCDRVLRNDGLQIGLDTKYRLLTETDTVALLRAKLFEFDLHYFRPLGNPNKFISALLQHFSRLADEDILPVEYLNWTQNQKSKMKNENDEERLEIEKWIELASAYHFYEKLKIAGSFMDFSSLISNTLKLFRERPNILKEYKKQFKYILVDEFQDTNVAQYELIKLLAPSGDKTNLTIVGDDSQSIYKFRGAAISNILFFKSDYSQVKTVVLTVNYRSTQNILDAAYQLIQKNNPDTLESKLGIDKNLKNSKNIKGVKPEFIYTNRVENEAELVAQKIAELIKTENRDYKDFAVLVRANNHSEPFIKAFNRLGLPYQFLGPARLFQQPEIKEIIAYLKVLYNTEDSSSMYKVLTIEALDINPIDISNIATYAKKYNVSLFEATEKSKEIQKVEKLTNMIHRHLKLVPRESAGQIAYYFFEEMGILNKMLNPRTQEEEQQAFNLSKFLEKMRSFEASHDDSSVFALVDWIDLAQEVGESPLAADFDWQEENAVNILTVHSAKGLEFPVVFVVNLVAQRFPSTERREQIPIPEELIKEVLPTGNYHLQEERRLFYVAMTRAKDRLYLTAADYYGEGKREKKLSPFIFDALGDDVFKKNHTPGVGQVEQLGMLSFSSEAKIQTTIQEPRLKQAITNLSYSQIECFKFCPLHYKLSYILNIPTPPSAPLSFGTSLHDVLKNFNGLLIKGANPKEKEILELLDKYWVRFGYSNKKHEEQMKKRGREYLINYLESNLYNSQKPPVLLEQPFVFSLDGCRVRGKIDRVDLTPNGIEIIDYKTTDFLNKDLPSEREMKKNLQLSIYALAALEPTHEIFGKTPKEITLSLYFFDLGKKITTTRTQKELEGARIEIIKTKQEIENSDFECSKNFFCKDCEYKMFCEVNS